MAAQSRPASAECCGEGKDGVGEGEGEGSEAQGGAGGEAEGCGDEGGSRESEGRMETDAGLGEQAEC